MFILIVNNDIVNTHVNTYSLENEPIPGFTQINNRNGMLIYTEKEAQLIAEPTDGLFTLH